MDSYKHLNENYSIDGKILHILIDYGYNNPKLDDIIALELTETPGVLAITTKDKQGRERKILQKSIGRILRNLFPDIDLVGDEKVQQMINAIKLLSNTKESDYYVKIYNNITEWYMKLAGHGITSCVNDSKREDVILRTMDSNKNIKIAVMYNQSDDKPIGRALIWYNVQGLNKPFLDRTYPENKTHINQKYHKWGKEHGYAVRDSNHWMNTQEIDGHSNKLMYFDFKIPEEAVKVLPYMDTFKYGKQSKGSFKLYNNMVKGYEYIFDNIRGTYIGGYEYTDFKTTHKGLKAFGACPMCHDIVNYTDEYIIRSEWDGINTYNNEYIHEYCKSDELKKCDGCDKYMMPYDIGYKDGKLYCPQCQVTKFGGKIDECVACSGNCLINESICEVCYGQGTIVHTYALNEAVEANERFETILKNYGYEMPKESIIKRIEITHSPGAFLVYTTDNKGNENMQVQRRVGRILKMLFPGIQTDGSDREVRYMIEDLQQLSVDSEESPYTLSLMDDVFEGYRKAHLRGVQSCVTWNGRLDSGLTEVMMTDLNRCAKCKLLVANDKNDENPVVARALVWEDVKLVKSDGTTEETTLIDRIYPFDNTTNSMYRLYARRRNWTVMDSVPSSAHVLFDTELKNYSVFPYMDTLNRGVFLDGTLHLMNKGSISIDGKTIEATEGPFVNQMGAFKNDEIREKLTDRFIEQESCVQCGDYFSEDDMINDTFNDELYCQGCANKVLTECPECDKWCHTNEATTVYPDYVDVCPDCIDDYSECGECNKYYDSDDMVEFEDANYRYEHVCENCADDVGFECSHCGSWWSNNQKNETDDGTLCNECWNEWIAQQEDEE